MEFRRITITLAVIMLLAFCAQAQVINVDRVTARSRLTVAGTEIDSITVDSTFSAASSRKVPTSGAVKAYVANNAGGGDSNFDSDRQILRVPQPGDNIGGSTVQDFLSFFYFTPPTLSLSITGGTLFEVGTSNSLTLSGNTSNDGGSTLSNGVLQRTNPSPANTINSFGASASYTQNITYTPQQGGSGDYNQLIYTFRASQDWSGGGSSGTVTSPNRTVRAVYPVLYGVSATDLHATGNAYTTLTKLVEAEGDKTVTLNGTGFQYYAMPSSWSDTSQPQILDQNDFNVTASFTCQTVSVSSSGLTNDWTLDYEICKSNTSGTVTNANYEFNQ